MLATPAPAGSFAPKTVRERGGMEGREVDALCERAWRWDRWQAVNGASA